MELVKFSRSVSVCEPHRETAEGCPHMCGMCPSCVFGPKPPPGPAPCVWTVSDEFRRRFMVELLLRCRDVTVLESIQRVLGVTSWSLFTYARSRSPAAPQGRRCRRAPHGKPHGVDLTGIWDWFNSSPDWTQFHYLCRLFSLCDPELLRMVANLTSVLLVRQRRGFLQFNMSGRSTCQRDVDSDGDSEDPALMVVPGSSKSVSGVSRYRDFISCLPVDLAKRILGLLDEHSLKRCQRVCRYWQHLAQETDEEMTFRRNFQHQVTAMMKRCKGFNIVSPTYANITEVPVPVKDGDKVDIHPSVQQVSPFEAAYAKIQTKMVPMEERNVYCGAYFTTVLLEKEDQRRVVDYRGGSVMAVGSKDHAVCLYYVASQTKVVSVMKGHVSRIRAVLHREDRDLLVTAGCDTTIRCWDVKTERCVMVLYGHAGMVNCLDVHADRLVSGARDCSVKVWSLHTGKHLEGFNFKHPSPVRCVKINTRTIYSSCDRGLVKIWDMENPSLLRVIDAHKSSVRCLFFDEWHLLSGDSNGQVMAWSISCDTNKCLMTFNHPKEVRSLTLVYLRVITGCVDGKIHIFNFLTGDCLRVIRAEPETGRLLSLHFHDNSILVNTASGVKLFQFAKVFWDYKESTERGRADLAAQDGLVSEKSAASSVRADHTAQVASRGQKMHDCNNKKPKRAELLYDTCSLPTPAKCQAQARERCETAEQSVMLSEKATSERIQKRGLHHPRTRDSILLRVNAIQKAQCMDEVSINMEVNARLRDSWGPHTSPDPPHCDLKHSPQKHPPCHTHDAHPRRAKTCVPVLKSAVSQNTSNTMQRRDVSTAPVTTMTRNACLFSETAPPHSADTRRAIKRMSGFTTSATEGPRAPECVRSLPNPGRSIKTSTSLPRIGPTGPLREQGGLRLLTVTQLEDNRAKMDLTQSCEQKLSKRNEKQETL